MNTLTSDQKVHLRLLLCSSGLRGIFPSTQIETFQRLFNKLLKGELHLLHDKEKNGDSSLNDENDNLSMEESDTQLLETENDPSIENFVSYIQGLDQSHDDIGLSLDLCKTSELVEILLETSRVLLKIGPPITRSRKLQTINTLLTRLQDAILESLLDEGLDADTSIPNDNGESNSSEQMEEDYLDLYYFQKLIEYENSSKSQ